MKKVIKELTRFLGSDGVIADPHYLASYSYDASLDRAQPRVVTFPGSTEDVARIVKIADNGKIPLVARGAGTGLSGGAIPIKGGIVVNFVRMNRILSIDFDNRRAVVDAGVDNIELQGA